MNTLLHKCAKSRSCYARTLALGASLLATAAANAQVTPDMPQTGDGSTAGATDSGVIVVTANKREQDLFDVPTSVSSVNSEDLISGGIHELRDLAREVPSLSFFSRGAAGSNLIILRGLSSGASTISPTVGFYVNDTPFGFSIPVGGGSSILQPDLDPSDMERVEILRGPQGTLYGASTLGGLIKYVTRDPDPTDLSGSVTLTGLSVAHGDFGYSARASANIPLVEDRLALRISGFDRLDPGYIDNARTGESDVNRVDAYGGRISLGFYPTDDLSVTLGALYQKNDNRSLGVVHIDPVTLESLDGGFTQRYNFNVPFNSEYFLTDARVQVESGDYTLTSSTSFGHAELDIVFDFTGLLPPMFQGSDIISGPQNLRYQKITQELRLDSPADRFLEWTVGLFFSNEDVRTRTSVEGTLLDGSPGPTPILSLSGTDADYREIAAFANATFNLTDELSLTAGYRLTENKITDVIRNSGLFAGTALDDPTIQNGNQKDRISNYLLALNYRYSPDGTVYARVASGYRPGGPIEPPPLLQPGQTIPSEFLPDSVWNYEIGARNILFDGAVRTDLSLFYINWDDIQLPFLVNGIRVLSNGGSARSRGFEFTVNVEPTEGFDISLVGSFTDAELTSDAPLVFGSDGDSLPYVPKWNLTASADYETQVAEGLDFGIGGTLHYQSGIDTALSPGDASFIALDDFVSADVRAHLAWEDVELFGYIRNVFNERAFISGNRSGGLSGGTPLQPRSIGLGVRANF